MTPTKHSNCNDILKAPIGSENCEDLHIQRDDDSIWSFWKPSAEELAAIVMVGEIAVRVMENTYPPVWIGAMIPSTERKSALSPEESRAISNAINERNRSLMTITKRAMSMLAKVSPASTQERQRLFDQFLDIATINHASGEVVRDPVEASAEPAAVTQADVDRYRSDAAEWKAEAARWRDAAEQLREATAVDSEAFKDAAQWQAEAERLECRLRAVSDAIGPDWNVFEFPYAITVIKDRLAKAESALDEWKADVNTWRSAAAAKQKRIDDAIEVLSTMTAPHKVDLPDLPNPNHPN